MNWTILEHASKILGSQKEEVKRFLVHMNNLFKDPLFKLHDDYEICEGGENEILLILHYDPDWQAELEELNQIRDYNRSKISKVRFIPRSSKDGCYIHVTWLRTVTGGEKKRKLDD